MVYFCWIFLVNQHSCKDNIDYNELNDPQSLNLYAYTKNGPVTYIDPTGHRPTTLFEMVAYGLAITLMAFRVSLSYTEHAIKRMIKRSVSPRQIVKALKKGRVYYDPKNRSKVYWYNNLNVCVRKGEIKTVYWGKPKKRFKRIK